MLRKTHNAYTKAMVTTSHVSLVNGSSIFLLKREFGKPYLGESVLSQVYWIPIDSHFWDGLMATMKLFFKYGSFSFRDGSEIRFGEDKWFGNSTLREQYPSLYNYAPQEPWVEPTYE
jgi:hypothetical protein